MTPLEKLIKHFERFPGVGIRQARRFAHSLLNESSSELQELSQLIANLKSTITECKSCFRFFPVTVTGSDLCSICNNTTRDTSKLMVLERDSDINAVERSGVYEGIYFVLGGTAPLLNVEENKKLRGGALKRIIKDRIDENLSEIILAFSVNPDGENTARYIESILKETLENTDITVTVLGRGLSTGSELEYADPETIKNAVDNRH